MPRPVLSPQLMMERLVDMAWLGILGCVILALVHQRGLPSRRR